MDNSLIPESLSSMCCSHCLSKLEIIVIHGHEQCIICKLNIFECCCGDTCGTDYLVDVGYRRI